MQTNCVRKTGAVFFGGREIIRGNLTRDKSTRSIIEACCIIKTKHAALFLIMQQSINHIYVFVNNYFVSVQSLTEFSCNCYLCYSFIFL